MEIESGRTPNKKGGAGGSLLHESKRGSEISRRFAYLREKHRSGRVVLVLERAKGFSVKREKGETETPTTSVGTKKRGKNHGVAA